jgi:hypothetical protein
MHGAVVPHLRYLCCRTFYRSKILEYFAICAWKNRVLGLAAIGASLSRRKYGAVHDDAWF